MSNASRSRKPNSETGDVDTDRIIEAVELFRENLVDNLRDKENRLESSLSNSNRFNKVRVFSKLPAENGKSVQLIAAAIFLEEGNEVRKKVRKKVKPETADKIDRYIETIESRTERYFPDGDVSYHSSSDQIVFHHLPKDILDEIEVPRNAWQILEPLLEYLFSDLTDKQDFKDSLAHEGTHSWLSKDSKKLELGSTEELRAAEESFCYFSGWVKSGIYLEENNLVESKTPRKEKMVWATQLMIEKAEKEDIGIDWARESAREMYLKAAKGVDPFLFIFKKALTNNERQIIQRYRQVIENSLQAVFEEFSEMVEDVEKKNLNQGQQISYERAKQIESQVDWDEPERAEQSLRKAVFEECMEDLRPHSKIDSVIHREMEEEVQKLGEYIKMVSKLEESLSSEQLIEEAEQVKQDLDQTFKQVAAAD